MSTELELKPIYCWHCGPHQSFVDPVQDECSRRWQVFCGRCGSSSGSCKTEAEAVELWSTRHESSELINLAKWSCERCGCRFPALDMDDEELANVTVCTSCAIVQSYENDNARETAEFEEKHLAGLREELATAQSELTVLRGRLSLLVDATEKMLEAANEANSIYNTNSFPTEPCDEAEEAVCQAKELLAPPLDEQEKL